MGIVLGMGPKGIMVISIVVDVYWIFAFSSVLWETILEDQLCVDNSWYGVYCGYAFVG